ncbi:putative membrane protein YphA (DoxX/SURF4 family) [Mucilaginibacter sp. SG538B]|uniref:MauE/DoxX family redox-associated membrane protein n=1 Tax=Mucilaginibacter sp. SG538B TaxID=2587021 RepID=UPI00159E60FB|nr:MauE/DoxX family redox-associated membrane protein [Mucilaginibacter sp. SG538B]NVM66871.1 putative membrane protein YphA (DoxX/SURF4 family) [Mucilaginibacter sp. SG538B]
MKKELLYELITSLLVLMFLYTGFSKILDFKDFEISMRFQHLPDWLTSSMTYLLPGIEIIVAALLVSDKTRIAGLYAFLMMMSCFTGYVGAALLHLFPKAPCACGGVIKSLGWGPHFLINLAFVFLAAISLRYYRRLQNITRTPTASVAQDISRARNQVNTGPVVKPVNISKY